MQRRALVGTIFVLVALILIVSSLFLPWYRIEIRMNVMGYSQDGYVDYYLDHGKIEMNGMEEEMYYDENDTIEDLNYVQVFRTTQILVGITIIGCVFGLLGALLVTTNKIKKEIGVFLVIIALILVIITPIYFMFALPNAIKEDSKDNDLDDATDLQFADNMGDTFFGGSKEEYGYITMEATWGGSTGWYLVLFSILLCIFAMIFVAISKPSLVQDYPPQYGPYPYYNQYQYPQQPTSPPLQQPYTPPLPPPPQLSQVPQQQAILNCPHCRSPIYSGGSYCDSCGGFIGQS